MRRTSSATSASSESASPVGLYAKWQLADSTRVRGSNGLSSGLSPKSPDFDPDDDLFGSAAWKKKRAKRGGAARTENGGSEAKATRRAADEGQGSAEGWGVQARLLRSTLRTFVKVRACVRALWTFVLRRKQGESGARMQSGQAEESRAQFPSFLSVDGDLKREALAQQTRLLCSSYIFYRLTSKGVMNKRVKATPYQCPVAEDLLAACQELERLYPRTYSDVSRRISMTMTSPQLVRRALTGVLEATFRSGITWAKVVSMVAIAAAFAEECVVQGHPNFVEDIVMCVGHFVAMHLTDWLAMQGGWDAFPTSKEPEMVKISDGALMVFTVVVLIAGCLIILLLGLKVVADTST